MYMCTCIPFSEKNTIKQYSQYFYASNSLSFFNAIRNSTEFKTMTYVRIDVAQLS